MPKTKIKLLSRIAELKKSPKIALCTYLASNEEELRQVKMKLQYLDAKAHKSYYIRLAQYQKRYFNVFAFVDYYPTQDHEVFYTSLLDDKGNEVGKLFQTDSKNDIVRPLTDY
jgi:hypothetical protein